MAYHRKEKHIHLIGIATAINQDELLLLRIECECDNRPLVLSTLYFQFLVYVEPRFELTVGALPRNGVED
jgi:hypothetical protein